MVVSVFLLVLGVSFAAGCDYAQLSPTHTVCRFSGPACPLMRRGMYQEEVDSIVDIHNKMRSKVATGQQSGQPSAANMKQITWNDELAFVAQALADQCYDPNNSSVNPHDDFSDRGTFAYNYVGQNIATQSADDPDMDFAMQDVMDSFYGEVASMQSDYVNSFPQEMLMQIGHYSQLMWADTAAVGCGLSKYQIKDQYVTNVVCNYGPAGNWDGEKIYEVGDACSKCKIGCSQKYDGLCQ